MGSTHTRMQSLCCSLLPAGIENSVSWPNVFALAKGTMQDNRPAHYVEISKGGDCFLFAKDGAWAKVCSGVLLCKLVAI